ncbi:hypothetical protein [Pseudomonas sp. BGI-2]|uniref:hypothetical protein n=1 Tax=Pseudomonas sp. BGI-2 TaxID=2528211 RepID=UPI001034FB3F|nr:hypothetical protein [Pseudomonas sp. BGI-2]TBN47473.1 hypothetical protein EYC95_10300 [Pseudomonas sp. BGI-2]
MQILDWFEQRRALKQIRKVEKENDKILPLQAGDDWERYDLESERIFEMRQSVLTRYLTIKAADLHVPLPDRRNKSFWRNAEIDDDPPRPRYLTEQGVAEARKVIREEQKARRDAIAFWIPVFFGAAGMVIGIAAALNKS